MKYITRDELLDLHTLALEGFGGRMGIKSQDRLLNVVNAPQQVIFGAELYPTLAGKAAVLGFQLLKNRPFVEGNEATALLAVLRFLAINDVSLSGNVATKLAHQLKAVLRSELDRDQLAEWLAEQLPVDVQD